MQNNQLREILLAIDDNSVRWTVFKINNHTPQHFNKQYLAIKWNEATYLIYNSIKKIGHLGRNLITNV